MRMVLTLIVRDEIDIIAANLDYHLTQGFDHVIVTDNGSVDGTRQAISEYAARFPITIVDEPPGDWSQHRWVTRMARIAHDDFAADWVVHTDADEFYLARERSLREALEQVPPTVDTLSVSRHEFPSVPRSAAAPPPVEMIYRRSTSLNSVGKRLQPKIIHRGAPGVVVHQGTHSVSSPRFQRRPAPTRIETFHYPVRSLGQFASKVRNAGSGYAVNEELAKQVGAKMRHWYGLLQGGRLHEEYERIAFDAPRLAVALESGELVMDPLLRDRFLELAAEPGRGSDQSQPRQ